LIKLLKTYKNLFWNFSLFAFVQIIFFFYGCDKEVSRSPLEPEAPKGFIYVDSNPRGFTIFLNDRNTGRITPDSISYIEADSYEITLKKKYFKDTSVVVSLDNNEKKNLFIDIISNPSMYGKLVLTTVPVGASITMNDSLLNQITPVTFSSLMPGNYTVKFELYNHRDKIISAIVESNKTKTYNEGLRDTSVWVDYQVFNSGIQSNSLTAIAVDQNNVKWIGTLEKGLIRFDEVSFVNYNTSNSSVPDNRINCISIDPLNRVWIGTDFGIGVFDGTSWTVYNRHNSDLTSELIYDIAFDLDGTVWIGTSANLVKFDGNTWSVYEEPNGRDWIIAIYIESENTLWLGTKLNGIFQFENENFTSFEQPEYGYPSKTISSIGKDKLNNIWFCLLPDTAGRGGISYWDGNGFNNYIIGSPQINVNDIFIDMENNKWVATSEGFVVFDAQNNSTFFKTTNSLLSSNIVKACLRDKNGDVWLTTFASGLNKYKLPR
jgi:streptogramin lyase